jgi:hypothetical protein
LEMLETVRDRPIYELIRDFGPLFQHRVRDDWIKSSGERVMVWMIPLLVVRAGVALKELVWGIELAATLKQALQVLWGGSKKEDKEKELEEKEEKLEEKLQAVEGKLEEVLARQDVKVTIEKIIVQE